MHIVQKNSYIPYVDKFKWPSGVDFVYSNEHVCLNALYSRDKASFDKFDRASVLLGSFDAAAQTKNMR